jgi:ABC-type transport system involved in multi-copper enzyme maturation permease subunit
MTRARMARYALWQLRDYTMERGLSTLLIGVFLGLQFILPLRMQMRPSLGPGWAEDVTVLLMLRGMLEPLTLSFAGLGTLIAVNGIVSNDRRLGYFRLLFAKPVSVSRYYAQAYVVHLVGLAAAASLLAGLFTLLVAPIDLGGGVAFVILFAIGIGGIGFLMSTLFRFDWLALSLVTVASGLAHAYYGWRGDWRAALVKVLPPVHELDNVAGTLLRGGTPDWATIAWFGGYGVACVAAGLLVLRRRPMAT